MTLTTTLTTILTTLVLSGPLLALPQEPLEVEITARDAEPVRASWSLRSLRIDTAFGNATVEAGHLAQILFGEPDVVVTDEGTELRGEVALRRLSVKVDGRSRSFDTGGLTSLVVVRDGRPLGVASFAGEWMTSFGPAGFEQRGTTVEGTYGFDGEGRIEGRIEDGALAFTWRDRSGSGEGRWELLDEDAFTGQFGEDDRFWGGYRKQPQRAAVRPGEVASGQTEHGVRYHVRLPAAHADGDRWPAICILHGSNMTSRAYVDTIASAWPELAERFAVVGLDGEKLSKGSRRGELRFNYTYINFSGPEVGPAWVHRQSPALVADALRELGGQLPVTRWFLGGHSQGGFLTYCLVMYYPELLAGAFPMSCNLLVQCEPDNFEGERARAQHRVPVAVIHGRRDDVVGFSGGAYCHLRLLDGGFPAVRLFAPERIGHQFALLPVDEALDWLQGMAGEDPGRLVESAEARARDKAWRDVGALLQRAAAASPPSSLRGRIEALEEQLAQQAEGPAAALLRAIAQQRDAGWVDDFLLFRADFATAAAAGPVLAAYARLREQQREAGDELFAKARGMRDKSEREAVYREIMERCYATKWYEAVRLWMQ